MNKKHLITAAFAFGMTLGPWMAAAPLPGRGAAQHPFLYAGEWDTRKPAEQSMFIVRGGKIVWQYSMPLHPSPGSNQIGRAHV